MAKEIFDEANELFVDDRYDEAYELYTKSIASDDKTNDSFTSKLLAARAQCCLKLKKYSEALDDSNEAVRIDQTNVKAFLRKGISLYHLDKKEEAAKTFKQGICIDADNDQMKVWLEKCEKELPATTKSAETVPAVSKPAAPLPPKIKHAFYQSDTVVTVQIPIKSLKREQVHVESTDTSLDVRTVIPSSETEYFLTLNLAHPIDSTRTTFNLTNSNIEIKLYKRQSIQWTSLEAQATNNKQPPILMSGTSATKVPSYPSSSQRAKDWDKLEAEIKKTEKSDQDEMGDANAIFQKLYRESDDETRKAMNKSMYESGGTCLNMNWGEVSKGKVTCDPPDGMEWKKYDS